FRLPIVKKKHPVRIPVDLMPQDKETLLEATGDPGLNYISEYTRTVSAPGDDASETYDIREYREGDRISRMHWKLSAKRDTLMLREFSREDNARFLFVLSFSAGTQEQFDRVVTNYYNLAAALPEEESAHVLVFEDPKGEITEIGVENASQLENTVLSVFQAYAADHSPSERKEGEKGLFSPHSAEETLEEYHQVYGSRRFLREFTVTDEALSVLAERWNEDEGR
ncbi:MAG: DUF58 domain-containing protein, partial [Lachnospiraceae bacterium]|nr:DUF58 domain-containing protein [Lachnospiraceae bacterium]